MSQHRSGHVAYPVAAANQPASPSRRSFLIGGAFIASSGALLAGCGGDETTHKPIRITYLNSDERDFVRAAIARLIPKDDLGPGAVEAGVDRFIDAQLAGPFGQAAGVYMRGPFHLGSKEQGYQLPFTPAQVYRLGILKINHYCKKNLGGVFAALKSDQQDKLLHQLEKGSIDLDELPSDNFFDLLWQNTKEGFLADPIYGGNRDFAGWKLIGYRGPRYNYLDEIEKFGKPYKAPYVSLGGLEPKMCRFSNSPTGRFDGPGCSYAHYPPKAAWQSLTGKNGQHWPKGHL